MEKKQNIPKNMIKYTRTGFKFYQDLKEREEEFQVVMKLLERDLKKGVAPGHPAIVKAAIEKQVTEAKKYTIDENFNFFFTMEGYADPIPKKVVSDRILKPFIVIFK